MTRDEAYWAGLGPEDFRDEAQHGPEFQPGAEDPIRAQLREECRQMREDITASVQRAEKAEAERDAANERAAKAIDGYSKAREERDAALGQVAALRGKLADIAVRAKRGEANCWSASDECGYAEIQRMAFPTLSDTAAAAAAYEARIRADERRKVLEETLASLMESRGRWIVVPSSPYWDGGVSALTWQIKAVEKQLAALDAESEVV